MYFPTVFAKHGALSEFGVVAMPSSSDPTSIDHWGMTARQGHSRQLSKRSFSLLVGNEHIYFGLYTVVESFFGAGHSYNKDKSDRPCEVYFSYRCSRDDALPSYQEMQDIFETDMREQGRLLISKKWRKAKWIDTESEDWGKNFKFVGPDSSAANLNLDWEKTHLFPSNLSESVWNAAVLNVDRLASVDGVYFWTFANSSRCAGPIFPPTGARYDFILNNCSDDVGGFREVPPFGNRHPQALSHAGGDTVPRALRWRLKRVPRSEPAKVDNVSIENSPLDDVDLELLTLAKGVVEAPLGFWLVCSIIASSHDADHANGKYDHATDSSAESTADESADL